MKPAKAIRNALEKSWLYDEEELKVLRQKLKDIEEERSFLARYRRTHLGFSND